MGVLFGSGAALEGLEAAQVVAAHKTGTVMEGRPEVTEMIVDGGWLTGDGGLLRLTAAAETTSEHPLARAIEQAALGEEKNVKALSPATDFQATPGHGGQASV